MKKILIGLIMMSVLMLGSAFAQTSPGFSNVDVASTIYEPFPAEPGAYIDLYVKVENTGSRPATNTLFELIPKYPFSIDSGEAAMKSYGSLEPSQPILLKYKVWVDRDAPSGNASINLRYRTGEDGVWFTVSFDIFVKSRDAILSIDKVESIPKEIDAGEKGTVEFTLKNLANTQVKDISLKLDLSDTTIPIAPIDSTTEKRLSKIDANTDEIISFNVITDAGAEPKVYKIPVTLTYTDESGTTITKTDMISLLISSMPELRVYMEESDRLQGGTSGNIILSVSNTGATQAKFVTITLERSSDYDIIGPETVYIGNLDSDDFDTVEYKLNMDGSLNDTSVPVVATVTFKDAYNKLHTKQYELMLKIYSLDELIRIGEAAPARNSNNIVIIVVLIIVGYLIYRYFRRKKES